MAHESCSPLVAAVLNEFGEGCNLHERGKDLYGHDQKLYQKYLNDLLAFTKAQQVHLIKEQLRMRELENQVRRALEAGDGAKDRAGLHPFVCLI